MFSTFDESVLKRMKSYSAVRGTKDVDNMIKKKKTIIDEENTGFMWLLISLAKDKRPDLFGCNSQEEILIKQWIEYTLTHVSYVADDADTRDRVFKELNKWLSTRVYFVANRLSYGDLVVYSYLFPAIESLGIIEKSKYEHLSRWFNHIQQDKSLRQSNKLITFRRYLR